MKEHPILFSGPMVRALLEGRKTQTRRVVERHNSTVLGQTSATLWRELDWKQVRVDRGPHMLHDEASQYLHVSAGDVTYRVRSRYSIGDRLWVRETFSVSGDDQTIVYYRATDHPDHAPWMPSIFLPRWACRLTLEITDIRVMRLAPISEEDFMAEGGMIEAPSSKKMPNGKPFPQGFSIGRGIFKSQHFAFKDLWDTLNAKRGHGWSTNPWVWAVTFKRIE